MNAWPGHSHLGSSQAWWSLHNNRSQKFLHAVVESSILFYLSDETLFIIFATWRRVCHSSLPTTCGASTWHSDLSWVSHFNSLQVLPTSTLQGNSDLVSILVIRFNLFVSSATFILYDWVASPVQNLPLVISKTCCKGHWGSCNPDYCQGPNHHTEVFRHYWVWIPSEVGAYLHKPLVSNIKYLPWSLG